MTIDAFEMALIHQTFRDELHKAPGLIGDVKPGDTGRSKVVSDHLVNIISILHHHHAAEDDLLWPLLRARVAAAGADVSRMQDEHTDIAKAMDKVEAVRLLWAATAEPEHAERLIDSVEELSALLDNHLADEEEHVVPLINAHITGAEWEQLLARGAAFLSPKNVRFALAFAEFALEGASPDQRRRFLDGVPAGPRVLLRLFGRRAFNSYRAKVYGARVKT
jgi:iron-sulfur cluster repair protein YtfE (RIC family)